MNGVKSALEPWHYKCDDYNRCVRDGLAANADNPLGLMQCKWICEPYGLFFPKPRNFTRAEFDPSDVDLNVDPDIVLEDGLSPASWTGQNLIANVREQVEWAKLKRAPNQPLKAPAAGTLTLQISLKVLNPSQTQVTKSTDESYSLNAGFFNGETYLALIEADNYFGARHAIETLFQAIDYDDVRQRYFAGYFTVGLDQPEFGHRGISLDTSRNFIDVITIKRIIDGMAHAKLNVFHWHIVDTQSFPFEVKGQMVSQMNQYGAYAEGYIYTQAEIRDIIAHANYRGVRVIPELDQPAHVGHGWNFPGGEDYTVCLDYEPWYEVCVQPPCGQLNIANEGIYDMLEALYEEFIDVFGSDTFHMGADEINTACWNSSEEIRTFMGTQGYGLLRSDYMKAWRDFQTKSLERLRKVTETEDPVIIWTNYLTSQENIHLISNKDYVVQIWTDATMTLDSTIQVLAENDFGMIFSNVDSAYLDCGYGAWVGKGNNWCSPYKGWQNFYDNDLYKILADRDIPLTDQKKSLILGGEACMWMEQVSNYCMHCILFKPLNFP